MYSLLHCITGSELDKNPLEVRDKEYIEWRCSDSYPGYGKWLIFRNLEDLNKTKELVYDEIKSGRLKVVGMKCSTLYYNPQSAGGGPTTTGRISVFTNKDDYIQIGRKLVKLVRHDIKYKVEDKYAHLGESGGRITSMTMFLNDGKPYAAKKPRHGTRICHPPCRNDKRQYDPKYDIWKLNVVEGQAQGRFHGKWILESNYLKTSDKNITSVWHILKAKIESGELPVIRMECPAPKFSGEIPEIHISTSEQDKNAVGEAIISVVEHDIYYITGNGDTKETLSWNDGKSGYVPLVNILTSYVSHLVLVHSNDMCTPLLEKFHTSFKFN